MSEPDCPKELFSTFASAAGFTLYCHKKLITSTLTFAGHSFLVELLITQVIRTFVGNRNKIFPFCPVQNEFFVRKFLVDTLIHYILYRNTKKTRT